MVSRRNFAAITVVMLVVLFLFQFLNVAKEGLNDYSTNIYAENIDELPGEKNVVVKTGSTADTALKEQESVQTNCLQSVVCIGCDTKGTLGDMIENWALYMKRSVSIYNSLDAYEKAVKKGKQEKPQFILLDPDFVNWEDKTQINTLQELVEDGISLIFGELPDVSVIKKSSKLRSLLGIDSVKQESVNAQGIHLYEGLLLGGEVIYKAETEEDEEKQDLELTFPWYGLTNSTKVYMKGMLEGSDTEVQDYPVLIWRKTYENAFIFAVNGNYMSEAAGLGILTGMLCEMQDYTIYPVVNAQNLVIANYPGLANENNDTINEIYSRDMKGVFRDIIWPTLVTIDEKTFFKLSLMIATQFDYTDENEPSDETLIYYMKGINEQTAEAGWSAYEISDTNITEKIKEDEDFWKQLLKDYRFSSIYRGDLSDAELQTALEDSFLSDVCTVVEASDGVIDNNVIGYVNENVTMQKTLISGYEHTYKQDLYIRSMETALGYTSILADISSVVYPKDQESGWEKLSEKLTANVSTYWKDFSGFDATTVSESDKRIRRFLSTDYGYTRKDDTVYLNTTDKNEMAWFILRTNEEAITDISGGTYEEIEKDVWLIEAESESVVITLRSSNKMFYHENSQQEVSE